MTADRPLLGRSYVPCRLFAAFLLGCFVFHRPCDADLEYLPIPIDHTDSEPSIELSLIPGLGGHTISHGPWNGHVAQVTGFTASPDVFTVRPPIGGCCASFGNLTKTSENAKSGHCDLAVNGSPFSSTGGCIGQSLSNRARICKDCPPVDCVPSLGLRPGDSRGNASWVIGTGLTYDRADRLGVSFVIAGHMDWLVRSGVVLPSPGGPKAPRTSIGITKDGKRLIILVVDGCEHCPTLLGGPKGLTSHELAEHIARLGAWHAINLDGGGSSTLVYKGKVINFPTAMGLPIGSFFQERPVSTIVCLRLGDRKHNTIG
uniref:Phosphodiester glycosidase domain-containing protein n=1 Tax=Trieres chinensis TaxID=1514140 RepID=A0A7S1ZJN5_TRICV|mmetsp:Transcript_26789/g.54832  ORF Transcript_26789/g.54832 Transcript_26789/m.54832 type:complete len:316 (+) Transcript_26789:30-977(+)